MSNKAGLCARGGTPIGSNSENKVLTEDASTAALSDILGVPETSISDKVIIRLMIGRFPP